MIISAPILQLFRKRLRLVRHFHVSRHVTTLVVTAKGSISQKVSASDVEVLQVFLGSDILYCRTIGQFCAMGKHGPALECGSLLDGIVREVTIAVLIAGIAIAIHVGVKCAILVPLILDEVIERIVIDTLIALGTRCVTRSGREDGGRLPACVALVSVAQLHDVVTCLWLHSAQWILIDIGKHDVVCAHLRHQSPIVSGTLGSLLGSAVQAKLLTSRLVAHLELLKYLLRCTIASGSVEVTSEGFCLSIHDHVSACIQSLHLGAYHGSGTDGKLAAYMPQLLDGDLSELGSTADIDIVKLSGGSTIFRYLNASTCSLWHKATEGR